MKQAWTRILCLAVLSFFLIAPGAPANAQQSGTVSIEANKTTIGIDETVTFTINGTGLDHYRSYDIRLMTDSSDSLEFVSNANYLPFEGSEISRKKDQVYIFAYAMQEPVAEYSGNGPIASFTFKGKQAGQVNLQLLSVDVMDNQMVKSSYNVNQSISVTVQNSSTPPTPVSGVALNQSIMSLTVGATGQLSAIISPANATNTTVAWFSSNESVATVNQTGKVTAKAAGTTTITVTTADSNKTSTCIVNVTSGSGSTSTPTPTPASTPKPTDSTINAVAAVNSEGIATVTVRSEDLQAAITNAKDHTVKINVQNAVGAQKIQVEIPIKEIQLAQDNKVASIAVNTGMAIITIRPDLLKNMDGGSTLQLSVANVALESLPAAIREQIGVGAKVLDFNLSVDGNKIGKFTGNDMRVQIPYTLKPGENPNKVVIYYLTDDGQVEIVKNGKYDDTTGTIEFKPKHFSKYAVAHTGMNFNDIGALDWAKDAIEGLAARSVIEGVGDGEFNPEGQVTRAEFITMLMNATGLYNPVAKASFTDVTDGTWNYLPIASAEQIGIVNGKQDGSFGVSDPISRQDMAVMIYRTAQHLQASITGTLAFDPFADQDKISDYALEAVSSVQRAGIVNGIGNNKFAPGEFSTRAQAATIIYRLYPFIRDLPNYYF